MHIKNNKISRTTVHTRFHADTFAHHDFHAQSFLITLNHVFSMIVILGSIHTCDLLRMNYCANFSAHTIPNNGYTTHY